MNGSFTCVDTNSNVARMLLWMLLFLPGWMYAGGDTRIKHAGCEDHLKAESEERVHIMTLDIQMIETCDLVITANTGWRVRVELKYLIATNPRSCDLADTNVYDYVDSVKKRERSIGLWCGGSNNTFHSWDNYLRINPPGAGLPIEVEYSAIPKRVCDVWDTSMGNNQRSLYSIPGQYDKDTECRWTFTQTNRLAVDGPIPMHLNFTHVEFLNTTDCKFEYIKLYSDTGKELETVCKATILDFYIESLLLVYRTGLGMATFNLEYTIQETCNHSLIADSYERTLKSQNYPYRHPNYLRCTYLIFVVPPNEKSHLLQFDVVALDMNRYCQNDYIMVYEGSNEKGNLLGRICGKTLQTFQSFSPSIFVVMVTSYNRNNHQGMKAVYRTGPCVYNLQAPGGVSTFKLPPYRNAMHYQQIKCTLTFTGKDRVFLVAMGSEDIDCFLVSVAYGKHGQGQGQKYCNAETRTFMSEGSSIKVTIDAQEGLKARLTFKYWNTKSDSCTQAPPGLAKNETTLIAEQDPQELESPGYPFLSPRNIVCRWQIKAKDDKKVEVSIKKTFDEPVKDCIKNPLIKTDTKSKWTKLCNGSHPEKFISENSIIHIYFDTNHNTVLKGFVITYRSIDGIDEAHEETSHMHSNINGIVAGVVVAVVVFGVITACCVRHRRNRARSETDRVLGQHIPVGTTLREVSAPFLPPTSDTNANAPPPSFDSINPSAPPPYAQPSAPPVNGASPPEPSMDDAPPYSPSSEPRMEAPPTYEEAVREGMVQESSL